MELTMNIRIVLLPMILLSGFQLCQAQEKTNDNLAEQLQGTWRVTLKDSQGNPVSVTKEVEGRRETLRTEREGKVLHEHVVDFEVKSTAGVLIFTYRNYTITQGPDAGRVRKDPVSYIYRVNETEWICIEGAMQDDEGKVRVVTYERVKNEVARLSNR